MAGPIDPTAIAQARAAGYSDTEIAEHLAQADDGVKKARDAGYSDKEIIAHISGDKPAPSGFVAGITHGAKDFVRGDTETAHQLLGTAEPAPNDPSYVPANITNGSFNPLNWNYSQIPQKIAEQAPGLAQDVTAASIAAKAAPGGVKAKALAGLVGGGLSAWTRTAGDTMKDVAANRTGDANAAPTLADKLQGGGTAALASAVGALAPTRFIPGANKVATVGTQGVLDSIKKYLATTAIGGGSSAASDAVSQLGTTGTYDPARGIEAAAGGAVTSGALAAPRGAADVVGSARRAEMGGDNAKATTAYNNRLLQNAGAEGLGNSKRDYAAQENTKAGLKKELQQVDTSGWDQDTANALSLAKQNAPLTDDHVKAIEAVDPEAGFLARQMRMAQVNEGFGSYDNANKSWSGGLSGLADKYAVRPFKSHLLIGGGSALFGAHMLGSYALPTLGGAAAAYGLARGVDNLTGARSPAAYAASRFADANVPTRMAPPPPQAPAGPAPGPTPWGPVPPLQTGPTGPSVSPPGAPQPAQASPWGPRPPMAGPTGPSVPPPAPPAPPAAPAPSINPMALSMLKQKLKAGLPPEPAPQAPEPPQAPELSPMALSMLKQKLKQGLPPEPAAPAPAPEQPPAPPPISPIALKMLGIKLKAGLPETAPAPVAAPAPEAPQPEAPAPSQAIPGDVSKNAKLLMAGMAKVAKIKADTTAPTGAPQSLGAAVSPNTQSAAPTSMADILNNLNGQKPQPQKISKTNGKVKSTAAPEPAEAGPYEPLAEHQLYPKDITPEAYALREAAEYGARSPSYLRKAEASARARIDAETALINKHPQFTHAIKGLVRQLHRIGSNKADKKAAVELYASHVSPEAAADVRNAFK